MTGGAVGRPARGPSHSATFKYDFTVAADMVAGVGSQNPEMAPNKAVAKLIQNAR